MVEDRECGLFADPKNPKDLARIIIEIKNNPVLRAKMGQNSRRLAEEEFDKSILYAKYVSLVEKCAPWP